MPVLRSDRRPSRNGVSRARASATTVASHPQHELSLHATRSPRRLNRRSGGRGGVLNNEHLTDGNGETPARSTRSSQLAASPRTHSLRSRSSRDRNGRAVLAVEESSSEDDRLSMPQDARKRTLRNPLQPPADTRLVGTSKSVAIEDSSSGEGNGASASSSSLEDESFSNEQRGLRLNTSSVRRYSKSVDAGKRDSSTRESLSKRRSGGKSPTSRRRIVDAQSSPESDSDEAEERSHEIRRSARAVQPRQRLHVLDDGIMSNSDMSDEDAHTQLQRDEHLSSAPPSYKIRKARKRRSQSTRVRRQRTESDSTTSSSEFERDPGGSQGSSSDSMVSLAPAVPVSVNSGALQRLASVQMEPMGDFQRSLYLDMVDESGFESATSQTVMGNRSQKKRRLHRHRVGAMDDWTPVTDPSEHATPWRSPSPGHLYVEPLDTTAKHFPSCYRCQRRPAWLELAAIRARQSHLRRAEVKHRKSIRAEKRRRRHVDPVDSRVHRRQGHYDPGDYEGIHDLGIARLQLQEQIEATRDSGAWLECCTCSASVHTGCLADGDAEKLLRTVIAESKARQRLSGEVEDRKASSMSSGFSPTDVLQGAACTLCKTSSKRCMICRHDFDDLEDNEAPSLPSFRCQRCLRTAHYACLEQVTGADSIDDAAEARQKAGWMCLDCE